MFSSFKHNIGLALNALIRSSDGCVPTSEDIPRIIAEVAWPKSITPVNLMSGFRKTGIHLLNPGCIHDRLTAPSKATDHPDSPELGLSSCSTDTTNANSNHMDRAGSINSLETNVGGEGSKSTLSSISDTMDVLLTQPKHTCKVKKKQESKNAMAVCITDDVFVDRLMDEKENKKKSTKKGLQNSRRKKAGIKKRVRLKKKFKVKQRSLTVNSHFVVNIMESKVLPGSSVMDVSSGMTLDVLASMKQLCLINTCMISVVYDFLFELIHYWCKCFNTGTAKMVFNFLIFFS